ncbi:EpsG family protein [Fusobacterium sp. SYSU M8A802]
MLLFCLFAALRYQTGLDWIMYNTYYTLKLDEVIKRGNTDKGFIYLMQFFKSINFEYYLFQFFISIFTGYTIYKFYKKYSKNPILCLLIYYNMYYLRYNMGLQKQIIALSFCIICFNYYILGKKIKSLLFYILALNFHFSSIVFCVVFLIDVININKKIQILFISGFLIAMGLFRINIVNILLKQAIIITSKLNLFYLTSKINSYLGDQWYGRESTIGKNLIITSFLIISYLLLKKGENDIDKKICVLSMFYVIFSCISLNFHVLDRFVIYFGIFAIILFSNILDLFKKRQQKLIVLLLLSIYFSYSTIYLVFLQKETRHYQRFIPYYNILTRENSLERWRAELGEIIKK